MHVEHRIILGEQHILLETGELARQASGTVRLDIDETVVLATVVALSDSPEIDPDVPALLAAFAPTAET